jgi:hypothetical protein
VKQVTVEPLLSINRPVVTNGQVRLDFAITPSTTTTFKLLQADQIGVGWTTNVSATLTTNVLGSSYRYTAAIGPAMRFYRIQTP